MKKIKFLPLLLVATLILSACGKEKVNEGMDINEENIQTEVSEKKSLKELLGLGISQKCTFEIENEGQITKGEVMVMGDKFRQTMEISTEEGPMKINTISDGEYFYSWNEGIEGSGTKIKIEENTAVDENIEETENINWNEEFDYQCAPVTLSDADLTPPSDIEFIDLSEMMQDWENMSPEELQDLVPDQR